MRGTSNRANLFGRRDRLLSAGRNMPKYCYKFSYGFYDDLGPVPVSNSNRTRRPVLLDIQKCEKVQTPTARDTMGRSGFYNGILLI